MRRKRKESLTGILFILPSILGVLVFSAIPFLISLWYSFFSGLVNGTFVGLQNYIELLKSDIFLLALKNTGVFMGISIPLLMILAFLLASMLFSGIKGLPFFRSAYIYPLIIPSASIILVWQLFFSDNGVVNGLLTGLGLEPTSFFSGGWASVILCILFVWKNLGYTIVLYLAGIAQIPKEYYEQAELEGISGFRSAIKITIPLLMPTSFFIFLLSVINSLKIFREVYLLLGNYPTESLYLIQHFMNNNFESLNLNRLSASAIVVSVLVAAILIIFFAGEKKTNYLE